MNRGALLLVGVLGCTEPGAILFEEGALDVRRAEASTDTSTIRAASAAIAAGRPWHATQLLDSALRDSAQRSPTLVLLAARAAAGWQGWVEVERLLGPQPWLDTLEGGAGRALLAQAAFEQRRPEAARHAARAVGASAERAPQLVLLARSLERGGAADSARATWLRAASELPSIADWLRLRAAGLTGDSAARAGYYASLTNAPARARVPRVEAAALERSGNVTGAIAAFENLGAPVEALRLRLAHARDSSSRAQMRQQLLTLIAADARHARSATELFDRVFPSRSDSEELTIARSAARVGPAARAAAGFGRAASRGLLGAQDRFTYGTILSQLGRDREAVAQFSAITTAPLAGRAAYQRARSLLRSGDGAAARAALDSIPTLFATDTTAASLALYLRGDLATDDRLDSLARTLFLSVGRRYPTSTLASQARFRAALIAFVAGDARAASSEFDSLATTSTGSNETLASTYWSGRAWASLGDMAAAAGRWRQVIQRDRQSYYAILAAQRLGSTPWQPAVATDSFRRFPSVDAGLSRAQLLEAVGMIQEAGYEYQQLADAAEESTERMLATAAAFRDRGLASRAMVLARQAVARGAASDARTYRLLYPIGMHDVLIDEASSNGVDHALVAALIRQESGFNPRATSPVGARGLMQIMPEVGRQLAAAHRFTTWDVALLYQPDVSLQLGTSHLAELLRGYPDVPRALAAYNAGSSRVARWSTKVGVEDPEVFVERIPFTETRDYVRIVQRNREMYRALYAKPERASGAIVGGG